MAITAHPDDEAGNFGGSLRLYRDRGVETCVLCLTPGQAATHRGGAQSDDELAAMRRKEFAAACEILRVSRGIVLNYPDGQLHRQDLYRVVYDLAHQVREFRPQVLMTFGPEGGLTAHTDHSMASIFATMAFHWAGRGNRYADQLTGGLEAHQAQKLYYSTADFVLPHRPPVVSPPPTTAIDIGDHLPTKIAAFKAHTSQSPLLPQVEPFLRQKGQQEAFHLVASANGVKGIKSGTIESDLFAGVREN